MSAVDFKLVEISDPQKWEELLLSCEDYTFVQSWQFGELHLSKGNQVKRWAMVGGEADAVLAIAQTILINAKRGKVLQLRHAPNFVVSNTAQFPDSKLKDVADRFLSEIKLYAKSQGCDFIRLQTRTVETETKLWHDVIKSLGYRPAKIHNIDAEKSLILDISKPEEALLQNMRKNTRYYIRKAEKDGVTVERRSDQEAIEIFYQIHKDTTIRQSFISFSEGYYKSFFSSLNSIPNSKLSSEVFLAKYEGKYIAAAIIIFFGRKAFYSDGGSLSEYSKITASYLLQWQAIQRAVELGATNYDFWGGVMPEDAGPNYPWHGIDMFKRGFGGDRYEFMHAHDLGLTLKYNLVRIWELIEKRRRGY